MEPLTSEDQSKLTRTARRLANGASWEAIAVVLGFETEKLREFIDAHRAAFSRLLNRAYRETVTEALFEGIAVVRARLNDPDRAESRRAAECLIRVGLAFRRERANRAKERRAPEPWRSHEALAPLNELRETPSARRIDLAAEIRNLTQQAEAEERSRAERIRPPCPTPAAPPKAQPRVSFASEKIEAFAKQGLGSNGATAKRPIDPDVAANWGISVEALERIARGEPEKGK